MTDNNDNNDDCQDYGLTTHTLHLTKRQTEDVMKTAWDSLFDTYEDNEALGTQLEELAEIDPVLVQPNLLEALNRPHKKNASKFRRWKKRHDASYAAVVAENDRREAKHRREQLKKLRRQAKDRKRMDRRIKRLMDRWNREATALAQTFGELERAKAERRALAWAT